MTELKNKRYEAVGFCIYCGASNADVPLEDEHIIPLALKGTLILPDASCRKCADAINKEFERDCLQTIFQVPRAQFKLIGRKRKRKRSLPTEFPIFKDRDDAGRMVDVPDYPVLLHLMAFPRPGLITNTPLTDRFTGKFLTFYDHRRVTKLGLDQFGWKGLFSPDRFCRFFAKIAHAYAVAAVGWGEFKPLLPDVIMGRNRFMTHLVGSLPAPYEKGNAGHMTRVVHIPAQRDLPSLLVANVWLFAFLGTPIYEVIVGTDLTPRGLERVRASSS